MSAARAVQLSPSAAVEFSCSTCGFAGFLRFSGSPRCLQGLPLPSPRKATVVPYLERKAAVNMQVRAQAISPRAFIGFQSQCLTLWFSGPVRVCAVSLKHDIPVKVLVRNQFPIVSCYKGNRFLLNLCKQTYYHENNETHSLRVSKLGEESSRGGRYKCFGVA